MNEAGILLSAGVFAVCFIRGHEEEHDSVCVGATSLACVNVGS